jgi:hypothetical protein
LSDENSLVTIIIPRGKYDQIHSVFRQHKDFIEKLKVADVIKQSLSVDIDKVRTILTTGRKE